VTFRSAFRRTLALAISGVLAASLVLPVLAQNPSTDSQVASEALFESEEFAAVWVATLSPTDLRAAPDAEAPSFGSIPAGVPLQVLQPQEGAWLFVLNPLTEGVAWVNAAAVGPSTEPTESEIELLRNPPAPSFEPWWGMTHAPAIGWSDPTPEAQAWVRIPQWRYLRVVQAEENGRVLTMDPRTEGYAWVDATTLGLVGAPPEEYFAGPPPDTQTLSLPGRIIGSTERFERPERQPFFSLESMYHSQSVTVQAVVDQGDGGRWYRIGENSYVPERNVRVPRLPQRTFSGRWIDADLSEPVMVTAYEGERPVYAALAVKGTAAFTTPTGVFNIWRRVENETMDSATLGIPRNSRDGYYLRNVLFTQYFTRDGAALHYNYWRSDWGYAGSHGCLGMNYDDSLFFWQFGTIGTTVYIHY
jgi:hypothetical protein